MHGVQQPSNVMIILANNGDVVSRRVCTGTQRFTISNYQEIQQAGLRCQAGSAELPADSNKYKLPTTARQGDEVLLAKMHKRRGLLWSKSVGYLTICTSAFAAQAKWASTPER